MPKVTPAEIRAFVADGPGSAVTLLLDRCADEIERLSAKLPCGHPKVWCETEDEYGKPENRYCSWCSVVDDEKVGHEAYLKLQKEFLAIRDGDEATEQALERQRVTMESMAAELIALRAVASAAREFYAATNEHQQVHASRNLHSALAALDAKEVKP